MRAPVGERRTKMTTKTVNANLFEQCVYLRPDGHPQCTDLAGKAVRLEYASGHALEQHWQTADRILWKGVAGPLTGYAQAERYRRPHAGSGAHDVGRV